MFNPLQVGAHAQTRSHTNQIIPSQLLESTLFWCWECMRIHTSHSPSFEVTAPSAQITTDTTGHFTFYFLSSSSLNHSRGHFPCWYSAQMFMYTSHFIIAFHVCLAYSHRAPCCYVLNYLKGIFAPPAPGVLLGVVDPSLCWSHAQSLFLCCHD